MFVYYNQDSWKYVAQIPSEGPKLTHESLTSPFTALSFQQYIKQDYLAIKKVSAYKLVAKLTQNLSQDWHKQLEN